MRYTFPRSEHLKSRKVIDRLFDRDKPGTLPGKKADKPAQPAVPPAGGVPLSVYAYPFRVLYFLHNPADVPGLPTAESGTPAFPQVLISVPKRAFKKAVDRNAVRRRVSEAYRLQKYRLSGGPVGPRAGGHRGPPLQINQLEPVTQPLVRPPTGLVAQIVFLYTAKTKISFEEIEKGMKLALKRIKK